MRTPSSPRVLTLSFLTTALVGCGEPPPAPAKVRAALRDDLGNVLREAEAASGAAANMPSGAGFSFATSALGGADGVAVRALPAATRQIARLLDAPRGKRLAYATPGTEDDPLLRALEQELFADANHLGDGIYPVPPSLVCTETTFDESTGQDVELVDADCARRIDELQLRIQVERDDGTMRFAVQLDADHDEPLVVTLSHQALAVRLNLDELGDALPAIAASAGEPAPNARLVGQITASLRILGAARASAALTFDRALSIEAADTGVALDGPGALRLASAAGTIVAVELDASAPLARFSLGLGATSLHVPGDALDPAATELDLGGATVRATLQDTTLSLEDISLGGRPMTVRKGDQQAMSIALNPDDGHTFDATLTADAATGQETLAVTPRMDLQAAVDHALLGDEATVYDVTRVQLDGALRSSALADQLEVLSGSLRLTTNPAAFGFTASAGQCVQATDVYDDATFRSYTTYAVDACP